MMNSIKVYNASKKEYITQDIKYKSNTDLQLYCRLPGYYIHLIWEKTKEDIIITHIVILKNTMIVGVYNNIIQELGEVWLCESDYYTLLDLLY